MGYNERPFNPMNEPEGYFICFLCNRMVDIVYLDKVENSRIRTHLICDNCAGTITVACIKQIIADTRVPKTHRQIFKQYLKWRKKNGPL